MPRVTSDDAERGVRDERDGKHESLSHLIIVQAMRADVLANDLAQRLRNSATCHPLDETIVVLQGAGMHRWLRREMAHRLGAWGGVETPFLRKFLFDMTARCVAEPIATSSRQDVQELGYRIAAFVANATSSARSSESVQASTLERIEPFLAACGDASGALQMETLLTHSHTLAESFERYEMDRPDMIASWEEHDVAWRDPLAKWSPAAVDAEVWQRALWREVVPGKWKSHDAWKEFYRCTSDLAQGACPAALKSIRFVSVFGVSILPPSVLTFLTALARHIPVCVHMLVATEEVIEQGYSDRTVAKFAVRQGVDIETFRAQQKRDERSNLREAFGGAASAAATVIDAFSDDVHIELCKSELRAEGTLLAAVQQGLREDRPARDFQAKCDGSFQFHSVSSAARAGEVVFDEVLRAFAELPGLLQEEVAILVPSMSDHATSIQTVFDRRAREMSSAPSLSLRCADAATSDRGRVSTVLKQFMDIATEDGAFASIQAIISSDVVCAAMDESSEDVRDQLDLIEDAGACRFFDEAHRRRWIGRSDPHDDELHTIEWAIDRVLLGTLAGDSRAATHAIGSYLPSDGIDGTDASTFHAVSVRIEALRKFSEVVAGGKQTIEYWWQQIHTLNALFLPSVSNAQWGEQRAHIDRALHSIAQLATACGMPSVDFAVARREFEQETKSITDGQGFATGAITLAQLSPMRSVPFRFIALVGIDRGVFPRSFKSDLMDIETLCPHPGDRNAHDDDLLLLLESIHAAEDRLVIVYEGIDASTYRTKPSSAVIDQFMATCIDHVRATDAEQSPQSVLGQLCRRHAAMGDAPEEWMSDEPAGFDANARARADRIARARTQVSQRSFIPTAAVAPMHIEIPSIEQMARVLNDPVKAFLKASGLECADIRQALHAQEEPIEFGSQSDALKLYLLRKRAIDGFLGGCDAPSIRDQCRLEGDLPHGVCGSMEWNVLLEMAQAVRPAIEMSFEQLRSPLSLEWKCKKRSFDVVLNPMQIKCDTLCMDDPTETQVLIERDGKSGDILQRWLEHLAWCASNHTGRSLRFILGEEAGTWLTPIEPGRARSILDEIGAWTRGASKQLVPFHGVVFVKWISGKKDETPEKKLERAQKALSDLLDYDRNIPLAFRGHDFFEYESRGEVQQRFCEIASWLEALLIETKWVEQETKGVVP